MNRHHMLQTGIQRVISGILTILAIAGCNGSNSSDQRLEEFAQSSMAQQSRQNEAIAKQATSVVQASHELANTANHLVEQDARARHDMLLAYRDLSSDLNHQKLAMDMTRQDIEKERRELARLRIRDPILAAAIQSFGLVLASLLPLGMAAFVIYQMNQQQPEHAAVAELLILDLGSDKPSIWPCVQQQLYHQKESALEHHDYQRGAEDDDSDDDHDCIF